MAPSLLSHAKWPVRDALYQITDRLYRKIRFHRVRVSAWGCSQCASFIRLLNETLWDETVSGLRKEITFSKNADCQICSGIRSAFARVYGTAEFGTSESLVLDLWPLMNGLQIYSLHTRGTIDHSPQEIYLLPIDSINGAAIGGRIVDSEVVDISRIKKWAQCCDSWHEETCRPLRIQLLDGPKHLRVIDVKQGCLTYIDPSLRYLALSYVWGKIEVLLTQKDNIEDLELPGALSSSKFSSQIPRTIRDAMTLTSAVGERYIWIDALCIIQDKDSAEKAILLRQMDKIYSMAYFTIVAAVGDDADAGLPGINRSNPRKIPQRILSYGPDRCIAVSQAPFEKWLGNQPAMLQGNCVWNQRGWTLQERLLSCRKVIFLEEGVHFNCDKMTWTEDVAAERQDICRHFQMNYDFEGATEEDVWFSGIARKTAVPRKRGEYSLRLGKSDSPNWLDYCNLVSNHTNRELSFEADILASFQGILSTLALPFSSFYCGLPERFFSIALLWRPKGFSKRRSGNLPSWSWAGWTGQIDAEYWRTACDWVKHEDILNSYRTASPVVFHSEVPPNTPLLDDWHQYRDFEGREADARLESCLPDGWIVRPELKPSYSRGRNHRAFFHVPDDPGIQYFHPIPIISLQKHDRIGSALRFHSETAIFTVSAIHNTYATRSSCVSILDREGKWCGMVDLNEELPGLNQHNVTMEVVKISVGEVFVGCMNGTIFPELEVLDRAVLSEWYRYVNITLLRQLQADNSGLHERVGIGRVIEGAWSAAEKTSRDMCLV